MRTTGTPCPRHGHRGADRSRAPSMAIDPEVMSSSPASIRSVVDFPHPDGPTRTRNSPLLDLQAEIAHSWCIVGRVALLNGFESYVAQPRSPLTDPAVITSTRYRWKTMKSNTTGMLTRMEIAARRPIEGIGPWRRK